MGELFSSFLGCGLGWALHLFHPELLSLSWLVLPWLVCCAGFVLCAIIPEARLSMSVCGGLGLLSLVAAGPWSPVLAVAALMVTTYTLGLLAADYQDERLRRLCEGAGVCWTLLLTIPALALALAFTDLGLLKPLSMMAGLAPLLPLTALCLSLYRVRALS